MLDLGFFLKHLQGEWQVITGAPIAAVLLFGLGCVIGQLISKWYYRRTIEAAKADSTIAKSELLKLEKEPKATDYKHINPPGFYKHEKEGYWCCQRCLDKDKRVSKLSRVNASGLICRVCAQTYPLDIASGRLCPEELKELEEASKEIKTAIP